MLLGRMKHARKPMLLLNHHSVQKQAPPRPARQPGYRVTIVCRRHFASRDC